jgi:hypothetical protein
MTNISGPVLQQIAKDNNGHFANLREAYRAVGNRTWLVEDFAKNNLENSRNLFTPESLQAGSPRPKALEVYALLSGLSFAKDFADSLVTVKMQISEILGNRLHYWVAPQNLGVEYCVFKWPSDSWDEKKRDTIHKTLDSIRSQPFQFHIGGIQINPDGCVVARGFDEHAEMFRIRALLKEEVPFLPEKQSGWAHVPLGRILEPLGTERFAKLGRLIGEMSDQPIASTEIDTMKFVHETRWYMEERETLAEYPLGSTAAGRTR